MLSALDTTSIILAIVVIAASAAARLGYYLWWRGAVGGRPVTFRKPTASTEVTIVRWPDRAAAPSPHSGVGGPEAGGVGRDGGGGTAGVATGRRDSADL